LHALIRLNVCLCVENQLVLLGYQSSVDFSPHHTAHLHGHGFAVMAMGFGQPKVTAEGYNDNPDIVCDSKICAAASWNKSRDV